METLRYSSQIAKANEKTIVLIQESQSKLLLVVSVSPEEQALYLQALLKLCSEVLGLLSNPSSYNGSETADLTEDLLQFRESSRTSNESP